MVIAIIGVLVSLLLPAVQAAREAARRTQCGNNVKQIGLGLLTHESTNGAFPPGGLVIPNSTKYGHSWWVHILPYLEQKNIYDKFELRGSGVQYPARPAARPQSRPKADSRGTKTKSL